METLSRLWFYLKYNPNKYRVIFNFDKRAKGKFKEFFELLNIPYNKETFIETPTQYKEIIIPEQSAVMYNGGYWHRDYLIPYDYMASKVKAQKYDKIYFTRRKLIDRNPVWNEKPIEKIFKQNGFRVFAPEKLSLKKQIALMKGCKELATIVPSTPHNLLFAKNSTRLYCMNRCIHPNPVQHVIDEAKNIDVTYINIGLNPFPVQHGSGPWIVGVTEELKSFCLEKNFKFPKNIKIDTISSKYLYPFYRDWYKKIMTKNLVLMKSCTARKNKYF